MRRAITAESLYLEMTRMPSAERVKFFLRLATKACSDDDFTYDEVFGQTYAEPLTAFEAAQYLEISIPTLRRYVQLGKLVPSHTVGRNQMFDPEDLRAFKMIRNLQH